MVLGKKVAILDWELGRNSAPRDGLPENPLIKHVSGNRSENLR